MLTKAKKEGIVLVKVIPSLEFNHCDGSTLLDIQSDRILRYCCYCPDEKGLIPVQGNTIEEAVESFERINKRKASLINSR